MREILILFWKILDVISVLISGIYMVVFVPICLVGLLATEVQIPMQTRPANLSGCIEILVAIAGGVFGLGGFVIAALASPHQICSEKVLKILIIGCLIAGIAAALCIKPLNQPEFFNITFCYTIASAVLHLIQLLSTKVAKASGP